MAEESEEEIEPTRIDPAPAEAAPPPEAPPRRPRALPLAALCVVLAGIGLFLKKEAAPAREKQRRPAAKPSAAQDPYFDSSAPEERIFRGHYGYILKLPQDYEAEADFSDAGKTQEVVYFFPKGTDRQHLINEGLYRDLGIMRLEVGPRRVPQGVIGIPALTSWVVGKLTRDKYKFERRDQSVHGMPGFVVNVSEPTPSATAYLVGQKVFYMLTGGSENNLFTGILSSITEVNPHDEPGN